MHGPGEMAPCSFSIQEADAGEFLIQGQYEIQSEIILKTKQKVGVFIFPLGLKFFCLFVCFGEGVRNKIFLLKTFFSLGDFHQKKMTLRLNLLLSSFVKCELRFQGFLGSWVGGLF